MKMTEITSGLVYAIPANDVRGFGGQTSRGGRRYGSAAVGTAAHVNSGRMAAPAKIIAIGKFRIKQSGLCAHEIVEDHYQTTAKVLIPDVPGTFKVPANEIWRVTYEPDRHRDSDGRHFGEKRIGYPMGLDVHSKKIKWTETVIPLSRIVMPWHAFRTRHGEFEFVKHEAAAYHARIDELRKQAAKIVSEFTRDRDVPELIAAGGQVTERYTSFRNDRGWSGEFSSETTHVTVDLRVTLPLNILDGVYVEIAKEIETIEKKLSCALD